MPQFYTRVEIHIKTNSQNRCNEIANQYMFMPVEKKGDEKVSISKCRFEAQQIAEDRIDEEKIK